MISREATGQEAAIPTGFCLSASLSPLALVSGVSGGKGEETVKRRESEGTESIQLYLYSLKSLLAPKEGPGTQGMSRSTSTFKTRGVLNNLKFYTGRLRPEVQPLPLYKYISTILYRKGTPFTNLNCTLVTYLVYNFASLLTAIKSC